MFQRYYSKLPYAHELSNNRYTISPWTLKEACTDGTRQQGKSRLERVSKIKKKTFLVFEKRIDDTDAPFQDGIQDPRLKFHHNFEWMGGSHIHPICVYALAVEAELLDGKRLLASNMECVGGAWRVWEYARCVIVLSLVGYRFHNVILHGLSH